MSEEKLQPQEEKKEQEEIKEDNVVEEEVSETDEKVYEESKKETDEEVVVDGDVIEPESIKVEEGGNWMGKHEMRGQDPNNPPDMENIR